MTEAEVKIFIEISSKHLNWDFSDRDEIRKHFLIQLTDLKNYFKYLTSCYYKLTSNDHLIHPKEKFGLIRINIDSVLPYYVKNNEKYVPYVYFEKQLKSLKYLAIEIEKWSYIYIKFCYLIHGIKYDFSSINSFLIISINIIKEYLAPTTQIQEYWPAITNDLISQDEFKKTFPVSLYPLQNPKLIENFSLESNLVQRVSAKNILNTEYISKMVRVKYAISFI